jgi:hypothetical protein
MAAESSRIPTAIHVNRIEADGIESTPTGPESQMPETDKKFVLRSSQKMPNYSYAEAAKSSDQAALSSTSPLGSYAQKREARLAEHPQRVSPQQTPAAVIPRSALIQTISTSQCA